jgi:DNA-binding NtrC family response regulator
VRELRNVIRRALLTCPGRLVARKDVAGLLSPASASPRTGENIERDDKDLILRVPVRDSFNEIVEECERVILLNALNQHSWNKSKVTKALKIPRQSLYNKIARYQLERTWEQVGPEPGAGAGEKPAAD